MKILALIAILFFASFDANAATSKTFAAYPVRPGDKLTDYYVLAGKVEDNAILKGDDHGKYETFDLGYLYDIGQTVTIRCIYASKFLVNVELKTKVEKCTGSGYDTGSVAMICQ